jgi:hypothetical protein
VFTLVFTKKRQSVLIAIERGKRVLTILVDITVEIAVEAKAVEAVAAAKVRVAWTEVLKAVVTVVAMAEIAEGGASKGEDSSDGESKLDHFA